MQTASYETKLTVDANGKPTAIESSTKVNIVTGAFKAILNPLTLADSVVTGPAAMLAVAVPPVAVAAVQRYRMGLPFKLNVFSLE